MKLCTTEKESRGLRELLDVWMPRSSVASAGPGSATWSVSSITKDAATLPACVPVVEKGKTSFTTLKLCGGCRKVYYCVVKRSIAGCTRVHVLVVVNKL